MGPSSGVMPRRQVSNRSRRKPFAESVKRGDLSKDAFPCSQGRLLASEEEEEEEAGVLSTQSLIPFSSSAI